MVLIQHKLLQNIIIFKLKINQNFKFPQGAQNQNQIYSGTANNQSNNDPRPMSRGNLSSQRMIPQQQVQNQPQTFAISGDQQAFQLPPTGSSQPFQFTGGPSSNGNGQQPQFHFIANQQKFYAQISPDKAPLLFRGRQNNQSHGGAGSGKQPMPYLQIASKTHTGSFPLHQMQILNQAAKYVSSTGQLEQQSTTNPSSHLVSLFAQPPPQMSSSNSSNPQMIMMNQIKVSKIKPNKNNIKEKEQLYEDAIKLKIQSNSYKEENIKLKTKIKILENEIQKKEKAMEDFLAKMATQPPHHQTNPAIFYSPITATSGTTLGPKNSNANQPLPLNNNFMASTAQKLQSETFLVMSLKKQLKDQKADIQKKDEEIEILKKNIKTTQRTELEAEIKTYKDELQRMRILTEELLKEGPNHPLYQKQAMEKINLLESQKQQSDFLIKQLQQDNQELANLLKQKDEDQLKKKEDKEKKSEAKNELTRAKKQIKEKDKEIAKLKQDLLIARKSNSNDNTTTTNNTTSNNNANQQQKEEVKNNQQDQVKSLQKKVKDLQNEVKTKKDKMDEQDTVIKKLQERLQAKIDELASEQKKTKQIEDEIKGIKQQQNEKETQKKKIKEIKGQFKKEIDFIIVRSKQKGLSHSDLCDKIKQEQEISEKLKQGIVDLKRSQVEKIFPQYQIDSEAQQHFIRQQINNSLSKFITSLKEACELELSEDSDTLIQFSQFEDAIESLDLKLTKDQLNYLQYKYYEPFGKGKFEIGFAFKNFLKDLKQDKKINKKSKDQSISEEQKSTQLDNQTVKSDQKKSRPQTARSNQSLQIQQKSSQNLKQIEEDDNDDQADDIYEDDFEDNKDAKNDATKQSIKQQKDKDLNISTKRKPEYNIDQEPEMPSIKKDKDSENLQQNDSSQKKKKRAKSIDGGSKQIEENKDPLEPKLETEDGEVQKFMDEEEMLDIAEHCFIRVAEMLLEKNKSARVIFTKYSIPEQFPDGTVLELMSPIAFLEGVKEAGMEDLSEMEAACLLRVLAKPELDNAIILNEFIMIMENFGVMDNYGEEDDDIDDYIRSEDEESKSLIMNNDENKEEDKKEETKPKKKPLKKIQLNFDQLEDKGLKILQKLARFLLERYLHPREFFGPAIYKQLVKTKKRENHVDILQTKDFYLRLKIAGIRKTVKEVENLNKFLCLDTKFPHLMQVKKVVKALEEVAQGEQLKLQEEMAKKQEELMKAGGGTVETEEDPEGDIGEDEKKMKKAMAAMNEGGPKKVGINQDLMRETGIGGLGISSMPSSMLTGGPSGLGGMLGGPGGYDYGMMRGPVGGHSSKIAMLMGFNHLNTIEEEKHETQTSNYFREGGESERDDSKYHNNNSNLFGKGSKILDDDQLLDQSGSHKTSPNRNENDHHFSQQNQNNDQVEEEEDEEDYEQDEGLNSPDQNNKKDKMLQNNEDEEYEEDEDDEYIEEEEKKDTEEKDRYDTENPRIETEVDRNNQSIGDMKSVKSDNDENIEHNESQEIGNKNKFKENQQDDPEEVHDESDYEF